jgi:hypothetical protein
MFLRYAEESTGEDVGNVHSCRFYMFVVIRASSFGAGDMNVDGACRRCLAPTALVVAVIDTDHLPSAV